MKSTITSALILESKGKFDEAYRVAMRVLDEDSDNSNAKLLIKRLKDKITKKGYNQEMYSLFMSENEADILRFKRWLAEL